MAARDACVAAVKEGAQSIISEAIVSEVDVNNDDTKVSTLTRPPSSSKKKQKAYTQEVARATLKQIQDGDEIGVKDKKTLKQMEDGIKESVVSMLLDMSKSSSDVTRKTPCHNAKQAAYHQSTMLANKNDVEEWYKMALKEGRTLYTKIKNTTFHHIANSIV